jgi:hypothetical protein
MNFYIHSMKTSTFHVPCLSANIPIISVKVSCEQESHEFGEKVYRINKGS